MNYLLCRNRVGDLNRWKRVLDAHAGAHRRAGLTLQGMWRGLDDPDDIFYLFRVDDAKKARAFASAPVATPDLYFLESIA